MRRLLAAALLLAGCSRGPVQGVVAIGSKNFTEQYIVGEMMARLIEAKTALKVKRVFNLGGTMICHQALAQGDIDLYAEYTGTALMVVLKRPVESSPERVYAIVSKDYRERFGLEWLPPFGFNNGYALATRGPDAAKNGWKKVSDLRPMASGLTVGFPSEFQLRDDGYPGLKKAYGFAFGKVHEMDPGLMYGAVAQGEVDVIPAFTTDGRIKSFRLATLADDRGFFPPYFAAPVVRASLLAEHPELRAALAPLAGAFDDATMMRLNYEVDELKKSPEAVAEAFLVERGLL